MKPEKVQRTPIQIRFNDIDMLQHVNNAMYVHYCDLARGDYFRHQTGYYPYFVNDVKLLIVVHTEFDFLVPSLMTDSIFVETRLEKVGERSLHFLHEIVDDKGNLRVRSRCVMSTFDKSTGKSFPLSDVWKF
ncbi:MAG TPA: thioesterase family protein [Bacteroidales bacterium]|jgi:acyl-CoA thioester hydrolase|nr:acyl-CoA thioesterase [Bacteroidales bacterium]MCZ2417323.1 acyl-CoA thioesterase [Burkholderiales bacterium]OQC56698.1 MAG: Long-chain acyl-CoA thioesterase FadM [Bacteroidetes bacterium ADurb.Bin013]MBP8999891.1 acyl-CoA thioesterase [Bacteroidales bacterium]MBV6456284.1 hypothetical protein [Bacteroidales bacterium]